MSSSSTPTTPDAPAPAIPPPAPTLDPDQLTSSTAQEGPDSSTGTISVSSAVDIDAGLPANEGLAIQPGSLEHTERTQPPAIPPEHDARLNGRERRTVWHMIAGLTYPQALDACGIPKRAELRDRACPDHVQAAVRATLSDIAMKAGLSREWIITNTVALYRRAAQAEEVLDRKGKPTGIYRFDGPTAAKCLALLAEWHPELAPRKGAPGFQADQVAALLRAVSDRGRPTIEARRERLIGSGSTAREDKGASS